MTEKEENIWILLALAWLSNADEETIKEIKSSIPQNDKEKRNAIQQKINDLKEELKKYE